MISNRSTMDLDAEYSQVREDLYKLGYHQPVPIGSLAIVKALLGDLVKTTINLKKLNEANQHLLKVNMNFICVKALLGFRLILCQYTFICYICVFF